MLFRPRRYLDSNPAGGGGNGGGTGTGGSGGGTGTPPQRRSVLLPGRAEAGFQALVIQHGGEENALSLARFLYNENHSTRQRLKDARAEVDAFKTRNPDGSLVLHGEQLADYNAWKALGKPADIKAQLDESTKTRNELAAAKRKEARTKAAQLAGYNPAALDDRLTIANLDLEIVDETLPDGTKKPVAKVRKAGDQAAQWEPLEAVATRDWSAHLPALKAGATSGNGDTPIIPFANNGASGATGSASTVATFIKNTAEAAAKRDNPLRTQGARTGT